ncbi:MULTISPECIES: hypothetical protein [Lactiplantibacillus]|uniref:hypothetical protein n=1 Tax=Lactiplantibacillus TaxID=2767842 RepID=UPI0006D49998|nr:MULTISPECIES: hypothetical protein [Lactiplantibacillus]ALG26412.1 hypothetical protein AN634_10460 [Lactiplantibacillus plantarum]MBP5809697.1 hypothetical protein [Lactiplantibacillus argentoratensis]MCW6149158.1 hypothetical protein [Lactiplantibacillus plantarum]TXJ65736.1 hypothetical protein FGO87_14490 [Lactiplantibacillus plantarum]TXJ69554.1 hypothetical protein FGO88_14425 [Lactiplantibacillus plantarum]
MDEIISFEFSNGSKLLDSNVYEYKVGKEGIVKIDFPDSNGFVAVHKNNNETAYIKAPYMKFCTGRHA